MSLCVEALFPVLPYPPLSLSLSHPTFIPFHSPLLPPPFPSSRLFLHLLLLVQCTPLDKGDPERSGYLVSFEAWIPCPAQAGFEGDIAASLEPTLFSFCSGKSLLPPFFPRRPLSLKKETANGKGSKHTWTASSEDMYNMQPSPSWNPQAVRPVWSANCCLYH